MVSGITSYAQNGKVDWGKVAISAVVGAAGGAIAATGLGALAQAGLTAAVSGAGIFTEQFYENGINNVNYKEVAINASVGGLVSLAGSGLGKIVGNKLNNAGTELINKGKNKLLTGVIKRSVGQSHSSLIRQGKKYIAAGMIKINTYRGLSSVIGSGIGGIVAYAYN